MKLTLDYINDAWEKYNKKYFNGELIKPRFAIGKTKNCMGRFTPSYYGSEPIIMISCYYERTEKQYDTTIIHEMIHQYIRQNNIKDTSAHHGRVFKSIANRINLDGWSIHTSTDFDGVGECLDKNKTYNVFVFKTDNGRYFEFVANENYVAFFKLKMYKSGKVFKFFKSKEPKYGKYPQCRSAYRGFYVSLEYYQKTNTDVMSEMR